MAPRIAAGMEQTAIFLQDIIIRSAYAKYLGNAK